MSDEQESDTKAGKWSKAAIEDRRRQVFEFVMMKGLSETAIAEQLGVHRNTIVNDVRAMRDEMRAQVKDLDVMAEIGDQKIRFERIVSDALFEAAATKTPGAKAMLIAQALRAMELKQRLLIETGFLPNAVKRTEGKMEVSGGLDIRAMSTPELQELRRTMVERLARVNLS